jgi:CDP-diacylglycerol pyrophosphatase
MHVSCLGSDGGEAVASLLEQAAQRWCEKGGGVHSHTPFSVATVPKRALRDALLFFNYLFLSS